MGLSNGRARVRSGVTRLPVVFVRHEASKRLITSRFFFVNQLITPSWTESVGERTIWHSGEVLPDRDSYLALMSKLYAVIDESYQNDHVRCYPHYIALSWDVLKHPEEYVEEIQSRIERNVVNFLGEYFNWKKPYRVGHFSGLQEQLDMAEKLGVNWTPGSRH